MIEASVLVVIGKITSVLAEEAVKVVGKEVSLLVEAEGSVKQIQSEFKVMQAFLNQVDTQESNDKLLATWLEEVRMVAFEAEDIIDVYAYFIGKRHSGLKAYLKRAFTKSKNIVPWHNIASQLKQIQTRLQNLTEMKDRYSIKMIGESSASIDCSEKHLAVSSYLKEQDELVGIGEEKEKLVQWLTDKRPTRSIISVWGMGGLGKTTLVRNVFNSEVIKKHFDCHVWISISKKYQVEDILRRMLREVFGSKEAISVDIDIDRMDHSNLLQTLKRILQDKRYLIILDDVWSRDAWIDLDDALVESSLGSRVVITTRDKEIASLAVGGYILDLQFLEEAAAWELFCRRVFRNEEDRSCPQVLEPWGRKIVSKCQGLPLAVVAMGSLLFFRVKEETEWRRFYDQLNWELTSNPNNPELNWVARVLNLSYKYLPSYLKNCFLYCSIFPEDYLIYRKRLIRLWVAEGFIEARGRQTLEAVAEVYLDELIQRCMLQVVDRNEHGRVKAFRMHDLVRELTVTASREENFCVVVDNPEVGRLGNKARRLSVHEWLGDVLSSMEVSRLRSFIVFHAPSPSSSLLLSVLSDFKYLSVLDLEGVSIKRVPYAVMNLFNLRHLGLRSTKIKELPKSLGRLRNLQTLDLYNSEIEKLPRGVTELKNLRHLFAHKETYRPSRLCDMWGVEAPKGLWDLKELQTLRSIKASKELVGQLGNLAQLRTFGITGVRGIHCTELCGSIAKMHSLSHLSILASDKETLQVEGLDPPQLHLEKFFLRGRLAGGVVPSHVFGNKLRFLFLSWSGLREDPLPSLSHLSNLASLGLDGAYDGQQLRFCAGWFPKLKTLMLRDMEQLNRVEIDEGALQILEELALISLKELKVVPHGIEFLISLDKLLLWEVHPELSDSIQLTEKSKVAHIPHIFRQKTGTWDVVRVV